jgi:YHS domain-containing protein
MTVFASLFRGVAVLSFAGFASTAAFAGEINKVDGIAIKGYDPVAYFTDHQAVPGSEAITAEYDGATFKFASAAHRDAFVSNPAKYAPQFGGFCAYGTATGHKADIDPQAFTIVDEKLYLNYSGKVRTKWAEDIPGYIAKANKEWPTVSQSTDVIR